MSAIKLERAGVSFSVGGQSGLVTLELRTLHDTITALRGGQVCLELADGVTHAHAQTLVEVLNKIVSGVLVTTSSDDQGRDQKTDQGKEQRNDQRKSAASH